MHILVVASWYKSPILPIAGNFFEDQARALAERGHKVALLWPEWTGSFRSGVAARFKDESASYDDGGISTYHLRVHPRLPRDNAINRGHLARRVGDFARAYAERYGKPDVVHAHSALWAGYAGVVLRERWGVPLVVTEHNSGLVTRPQQFSSGVRRLVADIARSSDQLLCVGTTFRQDLVREYGDAFARSKVVGNLVANDFFAVAASRPATRGCRWLNVGSLLPVKRQSLLLEAFRTAADGGRLTIVGGGPLRGALAARAREIGERVTLTGTLRRPELLRAFSEADAFVSTSSYETFGVAMVEALAAGRPVVTTDCGGPRDYVTRGNGVFAASDSPADIADAMRRVEENLGEYRPDEVRNSVSRYAEDSFAPALEEIYAALA